ncbi:MAG TPA: histidinol-phosphate transaminase [Frankiaceae bacterium]|nr:histidinol-phosphate transaminase [Frankiaceae bacterium]
MSGWDGLPLRDDLRGLSPYGAPQLDVPFRLNTNENPYPPSPALVAALTAACAEAAATLNRYPDRDAIALREDLAAYLTVESAAAGQVLGVGQVWAANGSNEILQQLCQAFGGPGRMGLAFEPTYTMHGLIALATATGWVRGERDSEFRVDVPAAKAAIAEHAPSLVFLCSPNNPTGTALELDTIREIHDAAPGMVIVDEAYAEFRRAGVPSAVTLLPECPRLVVTRTMSKAFALAGARVGYLAAAPGVVEALQLVRLPYHLSALTQAAARVALAHSTELLASVEALRGQRDRLLTQLPALGCPVVPSDANFVLFRVPGDQRRVWESLLEQGVLVRDVGLAGWLRVTAGTPGEMDAFLSELGSLMKNTRIGAA